MTPNEQFDAKATALRRAAKTDIARCIIFAEPEVLFGWESAPDHPGLDLAQYAKKQYRHPREQSYYDQDSERIKRLVEGLTISNEVDPIEVFLDADLQELIVLDGASRCAAISIIRRTNPDAFKRIRMQVFRGSKAQAIARMVAANIDDRREPLDPMQVAAHCQWFVDSGWNAAEICERLGKPASWRSELSALLKLNRATKELKIALKSGAVTKTDALKIAQLGESGQIEALRRLSKVSKGDTGVELLKARERAGIRPMGPNYQPHLRFDKFSKYLGDDFTIWMNGKDGLPGEIAELRNELIEKAELMSRLLTEKQ